MAALQLGEALTCFGPGSNSIGSATRLSLSSIDKSQNPPAQRF